MALTGMIRLMQDLFAEEVNFPETRRNLFVEVRFQLSELLSMDCNESERFSPD